MNTEKKPNKIKGFFEKIGSKNLIIICAVLILFLAAFKYAI